MATLYRPVGQPEYDLIEQSGWRRFPPRLDWQPIFYPVTTEMYAVEIARRWNVLDDANGNVGYVLRFTVDDSFLSTYERRIVGAADHEEFWIPAADLAAFNDHLLGEIEVIGEYR